jgi:hypothetical protein
MAGFFSKLFGDDRKEAQEAKRRASRTLELVTAYKPVFTTWQGQLYESELVRAAIDARARHFSKLKPEFIGTGAKTFVGNIKKRPNKWTTWPQFLYRVSTITDVYNNCLIVPTYDDNMNRNGLWPLIPEKIETKELNGRLVFVYEYGKGVRKKGACFVEECARITRFQLHDEFWGESNKALTPTMQVVDLEKQGIKEAIKNSSMYRFMARVTNFMDDEDMKNKRENFTESNLKGGEENGGLLLFPHEFEDIRQLDPHAYKVDSAQAEHIRTNIFNYFGVSLEIIQNKAIGDALMSFYEGFVEPRAIELSEALKFMIYSEREIATGSDVALIANRVQFMSMADKKAILEVAGDRGYITQNEGREILNLPPLEGGDVAFIRGEYAPTLTKINELQGNGDTEPEEDTNDGN